MTKLSTQDKTAGKLHEVAGAIKQKAGELTKNPDLEDEGRAERMAEQLKRLSARLKKLSESNRHRTWKREGAGPS